jgi:tripartite ATP-independent transporter DctM subunit
MELTIVLATSLTVLMLLAVPVAFALVLAGIISILWVGNINLMIVPQQIIGGIDSLLLLSIPFFLLAGDLMTMGGITNRLLDLTNALLGRFRGGLAMSNVACSVVMAGISGSAVADTSAIGRVLIPAMVKEGYAPGFAAALTGAANIVGPIIPPSIVFVIIGVLTNLSITDLFMAGVVPGILYAAAMLLVAYVVSRRRNYPVHVRASRREIWLAFRAAFWALLMPVLIIGGIRTGIFNVTECSAVAVVYALFVGCVVYRELKWEHIWQSLIRTARMTAVIMLIIGAAQVISWMLAYQNIPQQLADLMLATTRNPMVFLLMVNVLLLAVGTFLENGPALVMLAPVLYPIAAKLGIDPYHFSMIVSLNLVLGLITPPVAICLSIGGLIAGVPSKVVTREVIPFFIMAVVVLMLITYVPQLSLWLPHLLNGK